MGGHRLWLGGARAPPPPHSYATGRWSEQPPVLFRTRLLFNSELIFLNTIRAYRSKCQVVATSSCQNFTWCHRKQSLLVLSTVQSYKLSYLFRFSCLFLYRQRRQTPVVWSSKILSVLYTELLSRVLCLANIYVKHTITDNSANRNIYNMYIHFGW